MKRALQFLWLAAVGLVLQIIATGLLFEAFVDLPLRTGRLLLSVPWAALGVLFLWLAMRTYRAACAELRSNLPSQPEPHDHESNFSN